VPAAIVLAGGPPDPQLAPGLPNKAFLELGGRSLLARVVDAIRATQSVDRIVVVGPVEPVRALVDPSIEVIPEQPSLIDNMAAAAAHLTGVPLVLTVAADLPLITPQALGHFLDLCTGEAGFYYPVVPQAALHRRFPNAQKTFVRVADGVFCGGSVLLFNPALIDNVRPLVQRVIDGRKKPWLLAQLFGWTTVLKLAAGNLTIAEMEARIFEVAGVRGKAVILDGPELALDLDGERPGNVAILRAAVEAGSDH